MPLIWTDTMEEQMPDRSPQFPTYRYILAEKQKSWSHGAAVGFAAGWLVALLLTAAWMRGWR